MEIIDATPPQKLAIKLDFLTPMESHNITEFHLTPSGNATQVNWIMSGPNTYMGKIMNVFVSMDRLIGKDFEKGLTNMKAEAEKM
jgi:hypothetical protein